MMSKDLDPSRYNLQRKRHKNKPPPRLAWPVGIKSGKRLRSNNNETNRKQTSSFVLEQELTPGTLNGAKSTTRNKPVRSNQELWVDKFFPSSSSELSVAPKKVKEICGWLDSVSSGCKSTAQKLLILVGSPGVGKSTTVRVLAREKGFPILSWNESFVPRSSGFLPGGGNFSVEQSSAIDSFHEFLQQCGIGFSSLQLDSGSFLSSQHSEKPIVLLEDLPNLHGRDSENKFREIMDSYLRYTNVPTVMIFSDVREGKHRPQDLERLISPSILYSPAVTIMQIHPVTKPKMKKVLEQIARKQQFEMTKLLAEELHHQSGGDIRHAIMNMQLFSVGLNRLPKRSMSQNNRDVQLSTFHALGKLLYAKRTERDGMRVLSFDPEAILERSDLGVDGSLRFLEHHSVDFFTDITEISSTYDLFSDAAMMLEETQGRDNESAALRRACASSVAGRAVANCNTQPTPNKFRQFSTPAIFDVLRKRNQNQILIDHLSLNLASSHVSLPSVVGCTNTFVTELLPSIRIISPCDVDPVVNNLYSTARQRAEIVSTDRGDHAEEASLKEQAAILQDDNIEGFDSDGDEEVSVSQWDSKKVATQNHPPRIPKSTPAWEKAGDTEKKDRDCPNMAQPVASERSDPAQHEIIVIDDSDEE